MSQPAVKWGQAERYFLRNGYTIEGRGGDKMIIAPKDGNSDRSRQVIRVGHTSCSKSGDQILSCYLSKFKNTFGVTREMILED